MRLKYDSNNEQPCCLFMVIVLFIVILSVAGCNDDDALPPIQTLEFAPFKQECFSWFFSFCPAVRQLGDENWSGLIGGIEGYQWEWGYFVVIEYRKYPVDNPLQDAPGVRRVLERVVSKVAAPADYEFVLGLRASDPQGRPEDAFLTQLDDGLYQYSNTEIECGTPETCSALDSIIEDDLAFSGVFSLQPDLIPPLILKEIVCVVPNDGYVVQCDQIAAL